MTNEEYYLTRHQGDWRRARTERQCCGWAVNPQYPCDKEIFPGSRYLRTGLFEINGSPIILCEECARREA